MSYKHYISKPVPVTLYGGSRWNGRLFSYIRPLIPFLSRNGSEIKRDPI